jgi:putative ABC transport system substrate-binding protein
VKVVAAKIHNAAEIEHAIEAFAREPNGGLIAASDTTVLAQRELIVALAAQHRLPAAYPERSYVSAGGLMSYGVDRAGLYRSVASYVDRILKGAKPADLPVQQPTKFQFALNLKTAKALGIDVPASTLLRADEVIE